MGYIYGGSICTIAALSAVNSADGGFAARIPLSRAPCRLRTKRGHDFVLACEDMAMYTRNGSPTHGTMIFEHGASHDDSQIPSLYRRAWVVQERVLSPRTLYFSRLGIYWECCESILSDADAHAGRGVHEWSKLKMSMSYMIGRRSKTIFAAILPNANHTTRGDPGEHNAGTDNLDECHRRWLRLVEIYSHSRLTKVSDRWPALAGMVKIIESAMNVQILAGIWREYLLVDLLWTSAGHSTRSDEYRTQSKSMRLENGQPTWSWLSVDSGVVFGPHDPDQMEFTAKILSVASKLRSAAPGNELHLTIDAPMFRCEIADGPLGPKLSNPELSKDIKTHTEPELDWLGLLNDQFDFSMNAAQTPEAWALPLTQTRNHESASGNVPGFLRQKVLSGDVRQHSLTELIIVPDPVDAPRSIVSTKFLPKERESTYTKQLFCPDISTGLGTAHVKW
ncbi:uncharacterized protein A1O5_04001 [Cladophialophora psammophila CBS 110553]|uniref:Heterokaryon incompatibility domain-containing protein n=1 Tax=Cladophialophora psammophila CBS 110553 TaxID=1182543 RepID=W9WY58_9EURO|nr:uncharacterized protein A1O5_04001 [Cladophialophora psammophila CBS 110553]EXJ72853.1 hypothetical protein A1O5_04001 [Cladophialophora psammophila CBS 110553]